MQVEIWSDLVCPWCYVGLARFEKALAGFEHRDGVTVVHRSFELDPTWPQGDTMDVLEMLARKYRLSGDQARAAEQRVADLAGAEALPYETHRICGNTFDAHRLVHLARCRDLEQPVLAALYRANFTGKSSIFDADSLVELVSQAGLDPAEASLTLESEGFADAVRADEDRAGRLGISGVPFFLADDHLAVSGAQPGQVFAHLLERAWAEASTAA